MVGDHRVHQCRGMLSDHRDIGVDVEAGDRIALLRHGRRRAAPRCVGFEHLGHFGLHQQLDVHRNLSERAADDPEERADLGDGVAHRMPGNQGLGQAEFLHQAGLGFHCAGFQRRQRAGGAAEFTHQHPRLELFEPFPMPFDAGQDARHLVAEGDRRCLLQVGAADDRRVAVLAGQRRQRSGNVGQVALDQRQPFAHLQHGGGVGDVLGGCAPMAVLAELVLAVGVDLVHHRDDRVADLFGLGLELGPVDLRQLAVADDLVGRMLRDHAQRSLHFRQRAFDVQVLRGAVFVRPDAAHLGVAEHVAEDGRVDDGCGHGGSWKLGD